MIRHYLIGVIVLSLALLSVMVLEGKITGNMVDEGSEKIVVMFPHQADIKQENEGTIIFDFSLPRSLFMVGNKSADYLMFLNSETVDGLKVGYDVKEEALFAGLPTLRTKKINIMDGEQHSLSYTFHKGKEVQALYLDGVKLIEGEYSGKKQDSLITGFATYGKWDMIESPVSIDVRVE